MLVNSGLSTRSCSSLLGAQHGGDECLRLAALEHGGAVRARHDADFAGQRPDLLGSPTIKALAAQDDVAEDAAPQGR